MTLTLYNTLSRKKEAFEPLEPGRVRMYNCGPTVYSYAHIGNFASFVLADLLRRHLEYSGLEVTQVMNITDVGHLTEDDIADARGEDKLERKAREEKMDPWALARKYEDAFHEDRKQLNLLPAHHYPRATDHIPQMIEMIEELIDLGLAYQAGEQVYFEIAKFHRYGVLSGNTPDELLAGHRVEQDPNKRNPLDFTLWKKDPKHLMQWDSPWGRGFPGWHIECSAMSRHYLGPILDIHTGGEDNIFPHHECEIAQSSRGEDVVFSKYWLHRRHILVEGKKMSKSLGNFYTVRDILATGYSGLEIRYALLSSHYRDNSNFSFERLDAARRTLRGFREFLLNVEALPATGEAGVPAIQELRAAADRDFRAALDDDLNVSAALAAVHGFMSAVNRQPRAGLSDRAGTEAAGALRAWDRVLGVLENPQAPGAPGPGGDAEGALSDEAIEELVAQRTAARRDKDFAAADQIRDRLASLGVVIQDLPEGTRWHREP